MKKETLMRYTVPMAAVVASIGIGFAGISAADSTSQGVGNGNHAGFAQKVRSIMGLGQKPGVVGKVTAINGTTLTLVSTNPKDSTSTTYAVDVAQAKFMKAATSSAPTASTLSAISVGDTLVVRGTVSGTNVTATDVLNGLPEMGKRHEEMKGEHGRGVMGTVTAVSGTTVTLTGKDGKTYTIDASSAQIEKVSTITVSQIAVGDVLGVQGSVSGTTVTAKHIMDGVPKVHDSDK